ncbi:dna polymerase delta subunit 4 [Citrus sinensis]|uniref:uncharacterized protein LOC102608934 n=1 Tax=Citrus sinensis TaxID=2711 RepID=UPI0003D6F998|nr:uncharacterized protein LOC102608934 [Citrus sinensis]KAH9706725.1 dna polymerase delta subunit 4 [Citrus sinensis]GAY43209.1 hypothetical protein CUMW_072760 [Citrus unshiu]
MATTSSKNNMKGFYRQKKKAGGITKKTSNKKTPKISATFGSDVTQPTALISHGSLDLKGDYDDNEEVLRQFDMNMAYGPCIGMSRLARWERAYRLGLNPPKEIEVLLKTRKVQAECLWEDRV